MLQQSSNTNIRIKKSFNLDNSRLMKTANGLGQSKYTEPFGKYFIDKNKGRINAMSATKQTDRYLVNVTKLQRLNNSATVNDRPMNRTLSSCVSNEEFGQSLSKQPSTSQSHRSNLLTVNIKRLPRLNNSTNGMSVSHNKIQTLRQDVQMLAMDSIDLSTNTRDFAITFSNTRKYLEQHCDDGQRKLKSKVNDLAKLVTQTMDEHKQRSQFLKTDCNNLKNKNVQMKQFLQLIQLKIQNIQNSLGLTTAHHKHIL